MDVKEKPQNVHLKLLIFCHVLSRFNLRATDPRSSLCYANCFLGLTSGFWNKNFQEINLFICHCSFITLAQKTAVRFFKNTSDGLLLFLEFKLKAVFVHVPFIAIHLLIQYLPFKNFAMCRIKEFPHWVLQCTVCCPFSITRALNTAEYRLNEVYCVFFSCLFTALLYSLKKWAFLKYERGLLYSSEFVYFFFKYKVVSCCMNVYICSERLDYSY